MAHATRERPSKDWTSVGFGRKVGNSELGSIKVGWPSPKGGSLMAVELTRTDCGGRLSSWMEAGMNHTLVWWGSRRRDGRLRSTNHDLTSGRGGWTRWGALWFWVIVVYHVSLWNVHKEWGTNLGVLGSGIETHGGKSGNKCGLIAIWMQSNASEVAARNENR